MGENDIQASGVHLIYTLHNHHGALDLDSRTHHTRKHISTTANSRKSNTLGLPVIAKTQQRWNLDNDGGLQCSLETTRKI